MERDCRTSADRMAATHPANGARAGAQTPFLSVYVHNENQQDKKPSYYNRQDEKP